MAISPLPSTCSHVPDEAWMNVHQPSYLVKYPFNLIISKEKTFGYNEIVLFCSKILELMLLISVQLVHSSFVCIAGTLKLVQSSCFNFMSAIANGIKDILKTFDDFKNKQQKCIK